MLTNLIVTISLEYIHISNHHVVNLTLAHVFVNHISIKLGEKPKNKMARLEADRATCSPLPPGTVCSVELLDSLTLGLHGADLSLQ